MVPVSSVKKHGDSMKYSKTIKTVVYLFVWLQTALLMAKDPVITLSVPGLSPDEKGCFIAEPEKSFQVQVIVDGSDVEPTLKGLNGCDVTMVERTPQVNTFMGQKTIVRRWGYAVTPQQSAPFTIGPAVIEKDGKQIASNTVNIRLLSERELASIRAHNLSKQRTMSSKITPKTDFLCELETNKKEVIVGEPFIVTLNIYVRDGVRLTGLGMPSFNGFVAKDLGKENAKEVMFNDVTYQHIQKQYVLMAQDSGLNTINSVKCQYAVPEEVKQESGHHFFRMFFQSLQYRPHDATSNALSIKVQELPAYQGTCDAVGSFSSFKSQLEQSEVFANQPVKLMFTLTGIGNFDQIIEPKLMLPAGMKFYKSKTTNSQDLELSGLQGTRTFEYVLQPSRTGTFTIAPHVFTYFNTEKRAYQTLQTEPLTLRVKQREGELVAKPTDTEIPSKQLEVDHEPEAPVKSDIAFIHDDGLSILNSLNEIPWWLFLMVVLLPGLYWFRMLIAHKTSMLSKKYMSKHYRTKELQQFDQRLDKILRTQDIAQLYNFFITLFAYLGRVEATMVTEEWIVEYLLAAGLQVEKVDEYMDFLHVCARYHFTVSVISVDDRALLEKKARYWMLLLKK